MRAVCRLGIVAVLFTSLALHAAPPANPERFKEQIEAYEAADKANPPPQNAVLFAGASGIRLWTTLAQDFPEYTVINRGFGGSQISDNIFYAERIIIPCKPKLIIFQAGGNDINGGKSPETVLADFKTFVALIRKKLPETRIGYLSIQPAPARWEQREQQKEANRLIKAWIADQKNVDFINAYDQFLNSAGTPRTELFVKDNLHHNPQGYKLRTEIVTPYLHKVLPVTK